MVGPGKGGERIKNSSFLKKRTKKLLIALRGRRVATESKTGFQII
jgi:hypothetical protein